MAMSFYSNMPELQQDYSPIFEMDDPFSSDSYANLLPYFSSQPDDNLISLSPEIFPPNDFESCYQYYPKRQKTYENNFSPKFLQGYSTTQEFYPPGMSFSHGRTETNKKKQSGVSLSASSIAARQRRRKISEKTQELGKLVPGGYKMNTGEMFQAAYKYIKFLQAQVGILESIRQIDNQEDNVAIETPHLEILLASPTIQEKLYSEEKCLVPKKIAESRASDLAVQSSSTILNEIDQLLQS
ncbi:hypothetical protein ACFE04_005678 [Oxalis oulophora]